MNTVQNDLNQIIPDWPRLVETVTRRCTNQSSEFHGGHHWRCVARAGLELLRLTGQGDPGVVFLFALCHDSMRVHDGGDANHGVRAAKFLHELRGSSFFLDHAQFELLTYACALHSSGQVSNDQTIGLCWDSDRLNLWRLGVEPNPKMLSTWAARDRIQWASGLLDHDDDWTQIYEAYRSYTKMPVNQGHP